jgi:hypothetical protein
MDPRFELNTMMAMLGKPIHDEMVRSFFGEPLNEMARDEYYGSLEYRLLGVEVTFQEAGWVNRSLCTSDPRTLRVAAFHLHRQGHESYSQYAGGLPAGLVFNDSREAVLRKLGEPSSFAGGGWSATLKQSVPHWVRYEHRGAGLHVQFDAHRMVEMITLCAP